MKKLARTTVILIFMLGLLAGSHVDTVDDKEIVNDTAVAGVCDISPVLSELEIIQSDVIPTAISEQPEVEVYYDERLNDETFCDDLELLALTAYAEAEGECDIGQRLVVDTILNRVESPDFPDTIHEVIYQPGQFDIFDNGRIDRVELDEHIVRIVNEELNVQESYEVLYFNSIGFNDWSTPVLQEGNHYFSK